MFRLLVIFAFVSQLSVTTATFHCFQCTQRFSVNPLTTINPPDRRCSLKNEMSTVCMATIQIDYEQNNVSVSFDGFSYNSSNTSTELTTITHSMQMSFDTSEMKRTFQFYCYRNESCFYEITKIYEIRQYFSQINKLRVDLQSELFSSSNSADLVCENNQNETVPCPNGFCQLINDGESGFTRNCIPEGFSYFSTGIVIGSSLVDQSEKQASFMYTCNTHMCNNLIMAEKVLGSLAQYRLLTPHNKDKIYVVETTSTMESTTSTAVRILSPTMISIQSILLFAVTVFSKIFK